MYHGKSEGNRGTHFVDKSQNILFSLSLSYFFLKPIRIQNSASDLQARKSSERETSAYMIMRLFGSFWDFKKKYFWGLNCRNRLFYFLVVVFQVLCAVAKLEGWALFSSLLFSYQTNQRPTVWSLYPFHQCFSGFYLNPTRSYAIAFHNSMQKCLIIFLMQIHCIKLAN